MIQDVTFTVVSNRPLTASVFEIKLSGDFSLPRRGQFIDIKIEGKYLRRPISVCDCEGNTLTLIYKVVGEGTRAMSKLAQGETLTALCPLGNGFDETRAKGKIALVGGGVGLPPLYGLCKSLVEKGKNVTVLAGFNTASDVYYREEFSRLAPTKIFTLDGSSGKSGYATSEVKNENYDYFFACGPEPMLAALVASGVDGQLSYEARMGCGFGACMGCSCKTKFGNKRICTDGPVMSAEEMR